MNRRDFIALLGGGIAAWPLAAWAEQDDRVQALLIRILRTKAEGAASQISDFIKAIEAQLGWTTHLPWSAGAIEQRRFEAMRLLRQAPDITEVALLDATGKERVKVSRLAADVVASGAEFANDPKFAQAVANKVYYGPAYLRRQSGHHTALGVPYMTLATAGTRPDAGVAVAEVSLKSVWDIVQSIKVGAQGSAYVLDAQYRLIAHSAFLTSSAFDLNQFQKDFSTPAQVRTGRRTTDGAYLLQNAEGHQIVGAYAWINPLKLGWLVFVELPMAEAVAALATRD